MSNRWLRDPRQLRFVFLAAMLLLVSTLGLLGWRLLEQDGELYEKRLSDQREAAAGHAVIALERRIATVERELLGTLNGDADAQPQHPQQGAIVLHFKGRSVRVWPEDGLLFHPYPASEGELPTGLFDSAEAMEREKDYAGAIAALGVHAESDVPAVRAAALAATARVYRRKGEAQRAHETYEKLANLGGVPISGLPAVLSARLGILRIFEGEQGGARREAAVEGLLAELLSGRWQVSREGFDSLWEAVLPSLSNPQDRFKSPAAALASGAHWLWDAWTANDSALVDDRRSLMTPFGPVLMIWVVRGDAVAAFAATGEYVKADWFDPLAPELEERRARLVVFEQPPAGERTAIQFASATRLPWDIHTVSTISAATAAQSNRTLLLSGLVVLIMVLVGGWFVGHAVSRELAVARLQADFVSVVSHEFRTPLTVLCQLSELLKRGRMSADEDRRQCYEFIYSESHRLRRLVESLLNFGRLESGKIQYRFEPVDVAALLRQSAEEFMGGMQDPGRYLEVRAGEEPQTVRADRETLRCVFWNLFENAVKYSPGCDTVWVELARHNGHVEIAVKDRGVGIPQSEQKRIFEKFFRGSSARASSVPGTGIGLAMARQIVRAHGGDIELESEPSKGSTFRVRLPLAVTS